MGYLSTDNSITTTKFLQIQPDYYEKKWRNFTNPSPSSQYNQPNQPTIEILDSDV